MDKKKYIRIGIAAIIGLAILAVFALAFGDNIMNALPVPGPRDVPAGVRPSIWYAQELKRLTHGNMKLLGVMRINAPAFFLANLLPAEGPAIVVTVEKQDDLTPREVASSWKVLGAIQDKLGRRGDTYLYEVVAEEGRIVMLWQCEVAQLDLDVKTALCDYMIGDRREVPREYQRLN